KALAGPIHQPDDPAAADQPDDCDDEVERGRGVERAGVALREAGVDAVADERGPGEQATRLHEQDRGRDRDLTPVVPQQRPQPARGRVRLRAVELVVLLDGAALDPAAPHARASSIGCGPDAAASTRRYCAEVASSSWCVPSATATPSASRITRSASAIVAGR